MKRYRLPSDIAYRIARESKETIRNQNPALFEQRRLQCRMARRADRMMLIGRIMIWGSIAILAAVWFKVLFL